MSKQLYEWPCVINVEFWVYILAGSQKHVCLKEILSVSRTSGLAHLVPLLTGRSQHWWLQVAFTKYRKKCRNAENDSIVFAGDFQFRDAIIGWLSFQSSRIQGNKRSLSAKFAQWCSSTIIRSVTKCRKYICSFDILSPTATWASG